MIIDRKPKHNLEFDGMFSPVIGVRRHYRTPKYKYWTVNFSEDYASYASPVDSYWITKSERFQISHSIYQTKMTAVHQHIFEGRSPTSTNADHGYFLIQYNNEYKSMYQELEIDGEYAGTTGRGIEWDQKWSECRHLYRTERGRTTPARLARVGTNYHDVGYLEGHIANLLLNDQDDVANSRFYSFLIDSEEQPTTRTIRNEFDFSADGERNTDMTLFGWPNDSDIWVEAPVGLF